MRRKAIHPPRQERSRRSLARLQKAAAEVLEEHGLEGATIPRIARRAGLSPGSVYRRFADKDALLRYVYEQFFERAHETTALSISKNLQMEMPLPQLMHQIVKGLVVSYRMYGRLLRALHLFGQNHPDSAFRKRAEELQIRGFRMLTDCVLRHRAEMTNPDPEFAVPFGLLLAVFALREIVILDSSKRWEKVLPVSDERLQKELEEMLRAYLGFSNTRVAGR